MTRYFGTDGIRGRALVDLTEEIAYRIGRYIGQYPKGHPNTILISRDTRESGEALLSALKDGVLKSGGTLLDEGVSTTPSVSYLVEANHYDYGIMISASHNPYTDNGIKLFAPSGEKLSEAIEEEIEDYIDSEEDYLPLKEGKYVYSPDLKEQYLDFLASQYEGKKPVKILCDLANGSASMVAPALFAKLGIDATFINASPDGKNINNHCGSTHMEGLAELFAKGDYDLAFAFDGDADRCLAIDKSGRLIDGDAEIYLGALGLKAKNQLNGNKVVITVMSNFGLRKALDELGLGYEIVSVGDKYVQAKLKEDHLSIGGEQSGHVIFSAALNTGDGLLTAIKMLNVYENQPEVYAELPKLRVYPQTLVNLRFQNKEESDKVLGHPDVKATMTEAEELLGTDGRLLVRTSGTEPLLRVMAEHIDEATCQRAVALVVNKIKEVSPCAE